MKQFAMFTILVTMLMLAFVIIMLAIAGFCCVIKKLAQKRKVGPRLMKWA